MLPECYDRFILHKRYLVATGALIRTENEQTLLDTMHLQ